MDSFHDRPAAALAGSKARARGASGTLLLLIGGGVIGSAGWFSTQAGADPITTTWFRSAFGLVGLTLWLYLRGELRYVVLARGSWPIVITAATLMVAAWCLYFAAIPRISLGLTSVLFHVQPLWLFMFGAFWLKEPISRHRGVALVAAMVGLTAATGMLDHYLSSAATAAGGFSAQHWLGVVLCLAGAFCTACMAVVASRVRGVPATVLAWWQCAVGLILLLTWPVTHGWPTWGEPWIWLSLLGLLHTATAYSLFYAGMARLSLDKIAVLQFINPVVAIVIDWVAYDRRLSPLQFIGIIAMSVAIIVAERGGKPPESPRCDSK
jgi:drug/metabolite transporter (DMT)-like permease